MLWPYAETCQVPFLLLTTTVIESQRGMENNKQGGKEGRKAGGRERGKVERREPLRRLE